MKSTRFPIIGSLAILTIASATFAQSAPAPTAPATAFATVHAPTAQAIVTRIVARHREITLLGLHATLPGTTNNVIVACNDTARIGKPSSAGDLALIGKPKILVARLPEKKVFEVAMSVSDTHGKTVGMFVDQMDIAAIKDEPDALTRALQIRRELEAEIADEAALFAAG